MAPFSRATNEVPSLELLSTTTIVETIGRALNSLTASPIDASSS